VRVLLVVNPTASSVTTRNRTDVETVLGAGATVTVALTETRGHAAHLAREAARDGVEVVAVFAGDGTLNEATQGLVGTTTALAALPGGSTNVFARTLGFAHDPADAAAQIAASLRAGHRRRVGLGLACAPERQARHFLFHLGVGFDAAIIARMERHVRVKRHLAHPAFALMAADTWLRGFDRRLPIRVEVDGHAATGPYAVISNSDPYSFVGPRRMSITSQASLERPLAVTVFTNLGLPVVARSAWSAVADGRWLDRTPAVAQFGEVDRVALTASKPFPWQVDGDYLGSVERLDVDYVPEALTLIVP
jgi:diacylglycerol kinase family enzyme